MFERFYQWWGDDIGLDLGTANTLVYARGQGIIINEPSVVALNQKTGRVVAVGKEAKQMLGRTPRHLEAVRPLVNGVISDFEVTEEMLSYFIRRAIKESGRHILRPRVVVGVPYGITGVERQAVRDAAINAGARTVHIVEEPIAAALGVHLPISEPKGSFLVDIGGGTTDLAVLSLGGIVRAKSLHLAGDKFDQDIINYLRDEHRLLVGAKTAEDLKISIGSVWNTGSPKQSLVRGRDLGSGLPRELMVKESDIQSAIGPSVTKLIDSLRDLLEETPPDIVADILEQGVVLVGGGSQLPGLPQLFRHELGVPATVADDPLTAVVRGTAVILEDVPKYQDLLLDNEDKISPQQP